MVDKCPLVLSAREDREQGGTNLEGLLNIRPDFPFPVPSTARDFVRMNSDRHRQLFELFSFDIMCWWCACLALKKNNRQTDVLMKVFGVVLDLLFRMVHGSGSTIHDTTPGFLFVEIIKGGA